MNWGEIFVPTDSLLEIVVRGTVMYFILFMALRFFLKRNTGQIGVADLLVIVLVSEVSQNALVGEAKSVLEAALAVGVLLFWSFAFNWLSYHVPALARLTGTKPLILVEDGRMLRHHMRRELITRDELESQMRESGIDELAKVRTARLEGDGTISFIKVDDGEVSNRPSDGIKAA